jgi:hypothetical protein
MALIKHSLAAAAPQWVNSIIVVISATLFSTRPAMTGLLAIKLKPDRAYGGFSWIIQRIAMHYRADEQLHGLALVAATIAFRNIRLALPAIFATYSNCSLDRTAFCQISPNRARRSHGLQARSLQRSRR